MEYLWEDKDVILCPGVSHEWRELPRISFLTIVVFCHNPKPLFVAILRIALFVIIGGIRGNLTLQRLDRSFQTFDLSILVSFLPHSVRSGGLTFRFI